MTRAELLEIIRKVKLIILSIVIVLPMLMMANPEKKGTSNMKIREKIEKYLNRTLEDDRDIIPRGFIDFWVKNYGKPVDFTLKDKKGNVWKVDKILHLMNKNEIQSGKPSWRGFDGPEELDYSILYLESMMSNWEDHSKIIPFAGLGTKDMANYNLLVLDYMNSHTPKVSVWIFEDSKGHDKVVTITVANNFEKFLKKIKSTTIKED